MYYNNFEKSNHSSEYGYKTSITFEKTPSYVTKGFYSSHSNIHIRDRYRLSNR
jgi:hypothetical protein